MRLEGRAIDTARAEGIVASNQICKGIDHLAATEAQIGRTLQSCLDPAHKLYNGSPKPPSHSGKAFRKPLVCRRLASTPKQATNDPKHNGPCARSDELGADSHAGQAKHTPAASCVRVGAKV